MILWSYYYRYNQQQLQNGLDPPGELIAVKCAKQQREDTPYADIISFAKRKHSVYKRAKDTSNDNIDNNNFNSTLPNVVVVALDSISRPHFYRKLPETLQLLHSATKPAKFNPIITNDKNTTISRFQQTLLNYRVFEFELFNIVGDGTYMNIVPLLTGNI